MWVKICGITRIEDALLAAKLGADAIGFIFAPGSKRQVQTQDAREISAKLAAEFPKVERIGVFTQGDSEEISHTARTAKLTGLQLHGAPAQLCATALRNQFPEVRMIAASAWAGADDFLRRVRDNARPQAAFDALLVDSATAQQQGGTGETFDWNSARASFITARESCVEAIAAGGLTPANVAQVIQALQPYGVDVASGTESSPGVKDHAKLRAFLFAAREQ